MSLCSWEFLPLWFRVRFITPLHGSSSILEGNKVFSESNRIGPCFDPNDWILLSLLTGGTNKEPTTKIPAVLSFCFASAWGIPKICRERSECLQICVELMLWWSTHNRKKEIPGSSPLRAWLTVSQIKTTNYDSVIDSWCVQLCMGFAGANIGLFSKMSNTVQPGKRQVNMNAESLFDWKN